MFPVLCMENIKNSIWNHPMCLYIQTLNHLFIIYLETSGKFTTFRMIRNYNLPLHLCQLCQKKLILIKDLSMSQRMRPISPHLAFGKRTFTNRFKFTKLYIRLEAKRKMAPIRRRRKRYRRAPYKKRRYSKKKNTTRYNRTRGTVTSQVRRKKKKTSLMQRLRQLEGITKKHWDYTQSELLPESISWNGTSWTGITNVAPKNSFRTLLAIQGRAQDGTYPTDSNGFAATDKNTREGDKVFVSMARLRGIIRGAYPQSFHDPVVTVNARQFQTSDPNLIAASKTKVWMVILQDKRPSLVDGNGLATVNPLPPSGSPGLYVNTGPLEGLFQSKGNTSTLKTNGFGQALRSYNSQRFKVVFTKAYELSCNQPQQEFDVKLNINRMVRYEPPDPAAAASANNKQPINLNYVVMFCTKYDMLHNILPSTAGPQAGQSFGTPTQYKPQILRMSSRVYFKDV